MQTHYKAAIFDLDGVIVDTARYHYLAWRRLAQELGFEFSERDNELLKGVSREKSLEILLATGNMTADENEKKKLMDAKNSMYVAYISALDAKDILPGALECLSRLKTGAIRTALGSASKNTPLILDRLGMGSWFDVIVDGNSVKIAKPDPQCFIQCAQQLQVTCADCVVFEDSEAGLKAAKAAGMCAVGIGDKSNFTSADTVISGLNQFVQVQHLFGMEAGE